MVRISISETSMSRKKSQWGAFLLIVAVIGTLLLIGNRPAMAPDVPSSSPLPSAALGEALPNEAVLTIDFGQTKGRRRFSGAVIEGMTAADALAQASRAGGFDFLLNASGMPDRIAGVDGQWEAEKNGEPYDGSLATLPLAPGDELMLRAEDVR